MSDYFPVLGRVWDYCQSDMSDVQAQSFTLKYYALSFMFRALTSTLKVF